MTGEPAAPRWRLAVDAEQCIGSAACAGACARFRMTADGRAEPVAEVVDAEEAVRDAAECCPVEAITVTDADTGAAVAP
ncbi:ferredoxin [Streptomyces sp. NPDC006992]|uniref:ferredoxin n=1 Tax=unclassified Streptomyces TaxID=2593676 RepID=UPI0033D87ABA